MVSRISSNCLFCLDRLRKGVSTCKECQSSLWRLEHLDPHRRRQTQSQVLPACWQQNTLWSVSDKPIQSGSELKFIFKKNSVSPHVFIAKDRFTMKRKMGSVLSSFKSAKDSSHGDAEERVNKRAKSCKSQTDCATKNTSSSPPTEENGGGAQNCQAKTGVRARDKTKCATESKDCPGLLTGPLLRAREGMFCQVHQLFEQRAQNKRELVTVPVCVTMNNALSDDTSISTVPSEADVSSGQLAWLEYLPLCLPQTQSDALNPSALPLYHGSRSLLTSSLSLMPSPSCSYHSTSLTSATVAQSKQSEPSVKEEPAQKVTENSDTNEDAAPVRHDTNSVGVDVQGVVGRSRQCRKPASHKLTQEENVSANTESVGKMKNTDTNQDAASVKQNTLSVEEDLEDVAGRTRHSQKPSSRKLRLEETHGANTKGVGKRKILDTNEDAASIRQNTHSVVEDVQAMGARSRHSQRPGSHRVKSEETVHVNTRGVGKVKTVDTNQGAVSIRQNIPSVGEDAQAAAERSRHSQKLASHRITTEGTAQVNTRRVGRVNGSREPDLQADARWLDTKVFDDDRPENYHQKLKQLPRQWEFTRYGTILQRSARAGHGRRRPLEFTVMSYNILAQNLLEDHPYLYNSDSSHALEWKQRRKLLMSEIAYHSPDIMNLQEVNKDHYFDYLKPRLEKLGYTGCYLKRTGDKCDGCATLWKKDKFQLLHFSPVHFCRGGLLDRDNIAIIVELQPLRSARHHPNSASRKQGKEDKIVVANTHLLFNPRRGDIKLAQLMILKAEIDKHAYLGPPDMPPHCPSLEVPPTALTHSRYCPIILTGDFNMEPQSNLYKFVISGQMDYEGLLLREMSGQEEGQFGRNHILDRNFFSPMYGITDSCQYHTAVADRFRETAGGENSPMLAGVGTGRSERGREDSKTSSGFAGPTFHNSGHLWHHLNLVSAYRHRLEGRGQAPEVTTHHNRGRSTVDYIFYTVDSKEVRFQHDQVRLSLIRDGQLKLLARYRLMSARELDALGGIPNDILPSDHLCLITRFLLT